MTVVHVFGTFVRDRTEGITKNVEGLVDALERQGAPVRLEAVKTDLGDLNRRRIHLRRGWAVRRRIRAALEDPETELIHHHVGVPGTALFGRIAGRSGRARRAPIVAHPWNAYYARTDSPARPRLRDAWTHTLLNGAHAASLGLGGADAILVSSQFQARQLARLGLRQPVRVVPNGVDPFRYRPATPEERERARAELGTSGDPLILYYGHVSPWKGATTFVDALPRVFAEYPNARALLSCTTYGGDPERLRARAEDHDIDDRIRLLGPQDVPSLLAAADLAVYPATAAVGTSCHPNVLLEVMAAGLPVVASRVGSVPEVVSTGENGLLVKPGDAVPLGRALSELAGDERLRRRLSAGARRTIVDRFTWDGVARRMLREYRWIQDHVRPAPSRAVTPGALGPAREATS